MPSSTFTTSTLVNRVEARKAIWNILDVPGCSLDDVDDRGHSGTEPDNAWLGIAEKRAGGAYAHSSAPIKITNGLAYRIIKRGISSRAVAPLGEYLGLGKGVVAEYLDLDRGTANRRASKDLLLPTHAAESVLRLLELDQMAADTFETDAESSSWLSQPHPMLDGETPLECAKSSYGAQRVKDILLAIKYGGVA